MACPSITAYLHRLGFTQFEGNTGLCPAKIELLTALAKNAKTAIEVGFNCGHSADTLLRANPELSLMSIDIGAHEYVRPASNYINFLHPGRHRLIIGDSTEVFPTLAKAVNQKMDLIFIDGGHAYEIAKSDLESALAMSHADTIIVMDDTIYFPNWEKDYSKGPTTVWMEAVANGFIKDDVRLTMDQWNGISYGRPGPNSHTLKAEEAVSQ